MTVVCCFYTTVDTLRQNYIQQYRVEFISFVLILLLSCCSYNMHFKWYTIL